MSTSKFLVDQKLHIIKMCEDGTDSMKLIVSVFEFLVKTLNI